MCVCAWASYSKQKELMEKSRDGKRRCRGGREWLKEPGFSSVFPGVRNAGGEKIKAETPLLKLGSVKEASAAAHLHPIAHTRGSAFPLLPCKVRE